MRADLFFDGSSRGNPGPSGGGAILKMDSALSEVKVAQHIGHATCNEAEYQGLIVGLHAAIKAGVKHITIYGDSQLIISQVHGKFKVKAHRLQVLNREVLNLLTHFEEWTLIWIPREMNREADRLANWSAAEQKVLP